MVLCFSLIFDLLACIIQAHACTLTGCTCDSNPARGAAPAHGMNC